MLLLIKRTRNLSLKLRRYSQHMKIRRGHNSITVLCKLFRMLMMWLRGKRSNFNMTRKWKRSKRMLQRESPLLFSTKMPVCNFTVALRRVRSKDAVCELSSIVAMIARFLSGHGSLSGLSVAQRRPWTKSKSWVLQRAFLWRSHP